MKIRTKTRSGLKKIITITVIVIVLAGGYSLAAYCFKLWPFPSTASSGQTQQEETTGKDIKRQAQENQSNSSASGSTPVPNPTPSKDGGKSTVPITITAANQSGDTFEIRTLIGAIATGTCTITLTGPGTTYTATANVQSLPSSSTCEGFDIPTSRLASGTWSLTINFENDSLQGSASQTVTVQ